MDPWIELDEDALRQYIDARAVFEAWKSARITAAEVRGGMLWRSAKGRESLYCSDQPFTVPIVSVTGRMARMTTISPTAFVDFKRWMASTADRDPLKVSRDRLQASIVEELANRFQLGGQEAAL